MTLSTSMQLRTSTQSQSSSHVSVSQSREGTITCSNSSASAQRLGPRMSYLLGQGPVPPSSSAERAAASLRTALDGPHWNGQGADHVMVRNASADNVLVRVVLDGALSDMLVPRDTTLVAFVAQVCDVLGVSPNVAKLGWKTSDEPKHSMPHELRTEVQLKAAFETLIRSQSNPRRFKCIALNIIHLNPEAVLYEAELRLLQEKLRCAVHVENGGRWCYIKPGSNSNDADAHIPLGIEELNLWAKKMHDGDADTTGTLPPNCFRWATHVTLGTSMMLKRKYTVNDDRVPDDEEEMLLSTLLWSLNGRFPRLSFPRYTGKLQAKGLIYARSILHFGAEYFVGLGMHEGAVGILLEETERSLRLHIQGSHRQTKRQKNMSSRKGKEPARAISLSSTSSEELEYCDATSDSEMSKAI
ncbi:hypothetical protein BJ165DRAFT_1524264 [Panaeolus papilionaceus]|nr:hypothetical protein BJ165DRAFT_1524264 [Panaeolus papilionaceus]